jgi:hypothetical protein
MGRSSKRAQEAGEVHRSLQERLPRRGRPTRSRGARAATTAAWRGERPSKGRDGSWKTAAGALGSIHASFPLLNHGN